MTEGYKSKKYGVPTKRFVQTMDLKDDSELLRKYREAHDREHFWDEIKEGIRTVGILEREIYMLGNRLVMIVEAPVDFNWDTAMKRLATRPRQEEWEERGGRGERRGEGWGEGGQGRWVRVCGEMVGW